jgi:hypothetical protein
MQTTSVTAITPVTVIPSVFIIISNADGIRGMVGGDCPLLATILSQAVDRFPNDVKRCSDNFLALGQDVYSVSWDYLMMVRGCFTFMLVSDITSMPDSWPSTFHYTCVVTR